jgi:AcrR family transcriptional regulator
MRDIATRAGVAPGAAYRHFDTQHQLLLAVIAHLFAELEVFLAESVGAAADGTSGSDPKTIIKAMAHAYVSWGLANPGGYQLLFETTDEPELLDHEERPGLHLLEPLGLLLAVHHNVEAPMAAEATRLWSALHGVVSLRNHKSGMTWLASVEADVDSVVALFLTSTATLST